MKTNYANEWIVEDSFTNKRVDYWIKKKIPSLSYPMICKIIRKGQIKVNKNKVCNSFILKKGDSIKLFFKVIESSPLKKMIDPNFLETVKEWIIHKDKNILVFNKPSGIAVQGGSKINLSLDDALKHLQFKSIERPKLVHRIDKNTSGVLLVARNIEYAQYLTKLFRYRKIHKKYLLFVNGSPKVKRGIINFPIVINEKKLPSLTYFNVIKIKRDKSLIIAFPVTGRKNQLRRHFSNIGHPILGEDRFFSDEKYSLKSSNFFLHSLSLKYQQENKIIEFFAPPPDYFLKEMEGINFPFKNLKSISFFKNLENFKKVNL
jgi:23S rRNA pseudouridine955/2504/2580 synthase